jgi:5-bromo-4-chloroindolyl phosphate hydrolysis protein
MGSESQNYLYEYTKWFASHMIIVYNYLNSNNLSKDDINILNQHFEEMNENLKQVISILDKDNQLYKGLENEDPNKIIRDFKIELITNGRNR